MALDEKYTKGPFYLWTRFRNGGETQIVKDPLGRERLVVESRNELAPGEKVDQKKLGASDEQWVEYVDGGVVRPYPFPDMPANSQDSPIVFLQKAIREAAQSEEEKLVAAVQGATSTEETLVEAAATEEKK